MTPSPARHSRHSGDRAGSPSVSPSRVRGVRGPRRARTVQRLTRVRYRSRPRCGRSRRSRRGHVGQRRGPHPGQRVGQQPDVTVVREHRAELGEHPLAEGLRRQPRPQQPLDAVEHGGPGGHAASVGRRRSREDPQDRGCAAAAPDAPTWRHDNQPADPQHGPRLRRLEGGLRQVRALPRGPRRPLLPGPPPGRRRPRRPGHPRLRRRGAAVEFRGRLEQIWRTPQSRRAARQPRRARAARGRRPRSPGRRICGPDHSGRTKYATKRRRQAASCSRQHPSKGGQP